jgi:trans-2,3-dihydro-3-hydroxyanthranilate isomerase
MSTPNVTVVRACLRVGAGGSPTAIVLEDLANANSTACLVVHLAGRGVHRIAVDMGDALGSPATVTATAGPDLRVQLGGTARVLT